MNYTRIKGVFVVAVFIYKTHRVLLTTYYNQMYEKETRGNINKPSVLCPDHCMYVVIRGTDDIYIYTS